MVDGGCIKLILISMTVLVLINTSLKYIDYNIETTSELPITWNEVSFTPFHEMIVTIQLLADNFHWRSNYQFFMKTVF